MADRMSWDELHQVQVVREALKEEMTRLFKEQEGIFKRLERVETELHRISLHLYHEKPVDGGSTGLNMPKRFPKGEEPRLPKDL